MATILIVLVMAAIVLPAFGLVAYVGLSGQHFGRAQRRAGVRHVSDMANQVAKATGLTRAERDLQRQD